MSLTSVIKFSEGTVDKSISFTYELFIDKCQLVEQMFGDMIANRFLTSEL